MVLVGPRQALVEQELPMPVPGAGQARLRVHACALCRTDLHVVDGELDKPKLPLVLGHQIVGTVEALGPGVSSLSIGQRVGVPWLGQTCGRCRYCQSGRENLCDAPKFTGYDLDGGFAEQALADARFAFALPDGFGDLAAAPLLCAGLIGYRSLRLAGDAERLGLYGFGAAAHILIQVARYQGRQVFAFTRPTTKPRNSWPSVWAPPGPAPRTSFRPSPSTRPSCSPRWERSFPRRCGPCARAGQSCAAAST
jgi:alcohol dehydrogenase, propanol-preferring